MKEARIRRFLKTSVERQTVCFVVFVIFLLFYRIFKPNKIIGVDFYLLLFLCLIFYMVIFKYLHLIKNTFSLDSNERKTVVIGTIVCFFLSLIRIAIKGGSISPIFNISFEILFQTFVEELVFRVFLLGVLIEKIPLSHLKPLPFYFAENKKDRIKMVIFLIAISILFSAFHLDWITTDTKLLLKLSVDAFGYLALPFVLTNKKIYAPWLIHYVNNLYASG